ncbi:MAG: peptidylprolyl isomerase [Phycisphaerales bacterium]|jgi:FKBP-type peptidyl-prolyl cis-trans isomerase SlyD|nr:peptidylprolyl isomerase [Phycisphaerales bacterium]
MQIEKNTVATIDYTLTDPNGQVIDTSKGRKPLAYLHGASNIIPGLESALEGKGAGESLAVTVPAEQGYGARDPNLVQPVPRSNFQGVPEIKPGMQFQAQTPDGARVVTVVNVDDQNVTVDANHPLAGMDLKFDVNVVDVRPATPEEVTHGHAHGPDGHDGHAH